MKAVAYIRVSTREQDEEVQRRAIEDFCNAKGIEVVKWYVDKGESGGKVLKDRPQARLLLEELDKLKPDVIVGWALDRFGRTMLDTLNTIIGLENRGYKVITVKEEWLQTLDNNIRKLILGILSWVAEFERKRIRERQEEAWRQGKQKGRPPKLRDDELEQYLRKYPTLSLRAITDLINAERRRKRLPEVSYYTVYARTKKLGYRRRMAKVTSNLKNNKIKKCLNHFKFKVLSSRGTL